jgi:MoaA/NifB/PqqE/SkfB family radical SAM enzyme
MEIALVLTWKCNASCGHCSTSCGPYRPESLHKEEILRLMSEAALIDDGEPLYFHLTGGEPFLNFDLLLETVRHGASLQGEVSCVTNAYWAKSAEVARQKLGALREAGLTALAVSISRFHQRYVPLRYVRLALEAAASVGLSTELKGAVTTSDLQPGGLRDQWKSQLDADEINIFPVVPYLRSGVTLPEEEYYREPGLPPQVCPEEILCVEPDGAAMSCCGQAPSTLFLKLGNIRENSLDTLHQRFNEAGRQRILRERGPIAFAQAAIAAGLGHRLREGYAGPCDLCVHIGADPELRKIADELSNTPIESFPQQEHSDA